MGQMHTIRLVSSGIENLSDRTDFDNDWLASLGEKQNSLADECSFHLATAETPLAEKFSYFVIMAQWAQWCQRSMTV